MSYKLSKNEKNISHFAVGENINRGDPPLQVFSLATFCTIIKPGKSFLNSLDKVFYQLPEAPRVEMFFSLRLSLGNY
jgi:hypothetical protein